MCLFIFSHTKDLNSFGQKSIFSLDNIGRNKESIKENCFCAATPL